VNTSTETVIRQTINWINEVVIALNLCPFAAKVMLEDRVAYIVVSGDNLEQHLHQLADCFAQLDEDSRIETSLIIFPQAYEKFDDYLELLHLADLLLEDLNYTGTYQLASFHPDYLFDGSSEDDASNFTNRSPYPMLHLLRESSIEKAVASYDGIDDVPQNNIKKLQQIGYPAMQQLLESIMQK
jgi:uncharacterized protein